MKIEILKKLLIVSAVTIFVVLIGCVLYFRPWDSSRTLPVKTDEGAKVPKNLLADNPLLKYLPHQGVCFLVDYYQEGNSDILTTVSLYPTAAPESFNRADGYDYCKKEALSWIKSTGIKTESLNIEWTP